MSNLVKVPEERRQSFTFGFPAPIHGKYPSATMSWTNWADYHRELGQELAKRMREYPGPSTDDDVPPEGGTPVLMQMAA